MAFKIKDGLRIGLVDVFNNAGVLLVTANKAANITGGAASQLLYQTAENTTSFIANGTTGQFLKSNGTSAPAWADIPGQVTITDDNTSESALFVALVGATSGNLAQIKVDGTTTPLKYVPSTGILSAPIFSGSGANLTSIPNGALVNSSITINGTAISLGGSVANLALTTNKLTQFAATSSSELAEVISDETGSGSLVFATSPTLVTPVLGAATATTINKITLTQPATGATLTLANNSTLATSGAYSITLTATEATSVTLPTSGTLATTGNLSQFASTTSAQLAGVISDETGSGKLVFATSPTFSTSVLTDSATLAVFNTTATTVNAFGAATTINLGAGTGTTTVNNNLAVAGNLTVNGATTTVNSTTVTIDDPIFTLGGDTAPASDDNKDRGIEFKWHNATTAKIGFFGYDDSAAAFTFIPDATNTSEVFSGTAGAAIFGAITGTSFNKVAITAPTNSATLTLNEGSTLATSGAYSITLTATGATSVTLPTSGTLATTGKLSQFSATTSAELAGVISDETGTDKLVFNTSPTLVTPVLGVATATSINKVAITAPATGSTLTIADGKTLTASNSLTFTGTDGSSVAFGTGGTVAYTGNKLSVFAATTSAELAGVISDETGSGKLVFDTSPTLVTPTLGIASATSINKVTITQPATSATLTIANGGTLATSGAYSITFTATAATSVTLPTSGTLATTGKLSQFAATTSAELAGVISDETGSGKLVFDTSPTFTTSAKVNGSLELQASAATKASIDAVTATVASTSATVVDSWPVATYRSAKYLIQVTQDSNHQVSEIMIIHNGTTTLMTEYAVLETNGVLASFSSDVNAGNARLLITMGSATSATITATSTLLAV